MDKSKFTYGSSGGMLGGHESISVYRQGNKTVVEWENQPSHNHRVKTRKFKADDDLLKRIEEVYFSSNLDKVDPDSRSELIALDAPSNHYSLQNEEGSWGFSSYNLLNDSQGEGIGKIMKMVRAVIEKESSASKPTVRTFFTKTFQPSGRIPKEQKENNSWNCRCGSTGNTGAFCRECGEPREKGMQ